MPIKIAPSILSADFGHLAEQIQAVAQAGADWIHVDVMDGQFVPNLTIGPLVVEAARRATTLPLDVHLMIVQPERWIDAFARAGADLITIHAEATPHLHRALCQIREAGRKAGVAVNPASGLEWLPRVVDLVDLVLVMSVNPGFGGQAFIPAVLPKVAEARRMLDAVGSRAEIEVDGGVGPANAASIVAAGATVLVAGNAVYRSADYRAAIAALRG